jgi:hypothetical protein
VFSVVYDRIFLSNVLNLEGKKLNSLLAQPGRQTRYISELEDLINKKIRKIVQNDKDDRVKAFGSQYIQGNTLFLNNFAIYQELESVWGKIWMFRPRETTLELLE